MADLPADSLVTLTANVVCAAIMAGEVGEHGISGVLRETYATLSSLGQADVPATAAAPAVPVRGSIKRSHLVSLIDGKPYKMLRRHLKNHGHTPESYRAAYGLPADYPMVAADYTERRRELALKTGLGRKPA